MISGKENSTKLLEIDEIYVSSIGWKKKSYYYDYLNTNPSSIAVNIYPYPKLIKQLSVNNEKYVKSEPNSNGYDNLLSLPRM
ncbi:MAG: DUF3892 domain-containing protein [Bacilli bacterium]|nr:DUF3892 domain-containing protein [Bacilli bacterium]